MWEKEKEEDKFKINTFKEGTKLSILKSFHVVNHFLCYRPAK